MDIKDIYMHFIGYVNIIVEGFFIERFINSCFANDIFLWNIERENNTYLKARVTAKDFKKLKKIAHNTKCKIRIKNKKGLPILINKYKKRKPFFIFIIFIILLTFIITRFVWNIEITGNNNISDEEIVELLEDNGVKIGCLKKKINKEKIINKIRLERNDISWIGLKVKGTNLIISINEADMAPNLNDPNEISNIIADRDGKISKLIVQSGTAKVKVGDFVKKGDLLVEGIMEGEYTGRRKVPAYAEIYAENCYQKEEKVSLLQEKEIKTGNKEKKIEIKFDKFKINLHKRVSKFKKYDTIMEKDKLKFFSNYYLPIEIIKITNYETSSEIINYTVEELVETEKKKLRNQIKSEFNLETLDNCNEELEIENINGELLIKLKYISIDKIGTKENVYY